jgi:hypothetical protein
MGLHIETQGGEPSGNPATVKNLVEIWRNSIMIYP